MRIAIPVINGQIANHLGHCQKFMIADVEEGKIVQQVELPNPGHGPGGPPPVFIARLGVKQVLAWGMPGHAQGMFDSLGVKVQLGATGDAQAALQDYLAGTLKLTTEGLDAGGGCGHDH
jgi:predicted Fe-Mo cluster-binding NifX family protein